MDGTPQIHQPDKRRRDPSSDKSDKSERGDRKRREKGSLSPRQRAFTPTQGSEKPMSPAHLLSEISGQYISGGGAGEGSRCNGPLDQLLDQRQQLPLDQRQSLDQLLDQQKKQQEKHGLNQQLLKDQQNERQELLDDEHLESQKDQEYRKMKKQRKKELYTWIADQNARSRRSKKHMN